MFSYRSEKTLGSSDSSDDDNDDMLKKITQPRTLVVKQGAITEANQSMELASGNDGASSTSPVFRKEKILAGEDLVVNNEVANQSMELTGSSFNTGAIPKRKVNHVWTTVMSENILSEDLGGFGLKREHFKDDRSVESYDYTAKNKFSMGKNELMQIFTGKSKDNQKMISNLDYYKKAYKKGHFRGKHDKKSKKFKEKYCEKKLPFNAEKEEAVKVSKQIASKLNEPNEELICKTVRCLGSKKALETLQSVEDIEKNGGMKVLDGSRLRTPGGIYLYLIKTNPQIERHFKNFIFEDNFVDHKLHKGRAQRKMHKKFESKKKSYLKNSIQNDQMDDSSDRLKFLPNQLDIKLENSEDSLESGTTDFTSSSTTSSNSISPVEPEMTSIPTISTDAQDMEEIEDGEITD